jgi:hypothetical protein
MIRRIMVSSNECPFHPAVVFAESDQLAVFESTKRLPIRSEVNAFQEIGLAAAILTQKEIHFVMEGEVSMLVISIVFE